MSLKAKSLGTMSSAAAGILITAGVAATPWVATATAGHRQKVGDRLAITGLTTFTTIPNGEFTVSATAATTLTLDGASAVGAYGGTSVVCALMDKSPFIAKHSAVVSLNDLSAAAVFAGTVLLEVADSMTTVSAGAFSYTNSSGVATAGFKDALMSGEIAIPAFSVASPSIMVEVMMARYMRARCSAYTTGSMTANVLA